MQYAAVCKDGQYMNTYHATAITNVDLTSATSVGAHAFTYCRDIVNVK